MNELERRTLLSAAGIGALAAMSKAGPLNPPAGPVTGTGRTLDDVYNKIAGEGRIAIPGRTTPLVIDTSGSYYLTGDIDCNSGAAVSILAHGVTLDLNGYRITQSSPVSTGVFVSSSVGTTICNGEISGFISGVNATDLTADLLVQDIAFRAISSRGVFSLGRCGVVRRCRFQDTAAVSAQTVIAIEVGGECSVVDECIVARFVGPAATQFIGINVENVSCLVTRCAVSNTSLTPSSVGISLSSASSVYRDNTVIAMATKYAGGTNGGGNV